MGKPLVRRILTFPTRKGPHVTEAYHSNAGFPLSPHNMAASGRCPSTWATAGLQAVIPCLALCPPKVPASYPPLVRLPRTVRAHVQIQAQANQPSLPTELYLLYTHSLASGLWAPAHS